MSGRLEELVRQSNSAEVTLFPDEVDLLAEICRRIDNEPDGEAAWRQVDGIELTGVFQQPPETNDVHRVIAHNILRSTIAYIDLKYGKVASGVLVAVGDRVFLATTAHSVPARPTGRLSFVGDKSTSIEENIPRILGSAKDPQDEQRDVAYVELERAFVEDRFGKAAIPLSRVYLCGTGQNQLWTFVAGYPSAEIRSLKEAQRQVDTKLFTLECWSNKLLMSDRWDALEKKSRSPDERLDVFIPRPLGDDFVSIGTAQNLTPGQLAEPFGMSGGGYWQPNPALRSNIWSPEHYSLIAIQSRWWGGGRHLQGTQIVHWLRLLWKHEADLRHLLEESFPGHDLSE
jgi:hypothetical protein